MLTGPAHCGADPVKSNVNRSPWISRATLIDKGVSSMPSLSRKSSASQRPFGRASSSERIRRSARCPKATSAAETVSAPYSSRSSSIRLTPRSSALSWPFKSPLADCGKRVLRNMMSMMSWLIFPALASLTGGRTNASWKTSVAAGL